MKDLLKNLAIGATFAATGIAVAVLMSHGVKALDSDPSKEPDFYTDTNGCQYFAKSFTPRLNPNGTQICKKL